MLLDVHAGFGTHSFASNRSIRQVSIQVIDILDPIAGDTSLATPDPYGVVRVRCAEQMSQEPERSHLHDRGATCGWLEGVEEEM